MTPPVRILLFSLVGAMLFASNGGASVVFKPGHKAKYIAPGDEEVSGTAQQLFDQAQAAEKAGNTNRAIRIYTTLVRKHPKDTLAAGAGYRRAQLLEQNHDYLKAAETYRIVVERYPKFERFDEAIEAQFRIGEMYLNGKKAKFLGMPIANALDKSVDIFAAIIRTAPYGKYTARAQFNIGLAREKQGNNDAALAAYQAVIDKFPDEPIAADAQYQLGYVWFRAAKTGTKDAAAAKNAKLGFQDFLFKHPNSEKAAQAREDMKMLDTKQTANAFQVARFYDKQKNYRAAVIYYNDVIRQQPGSREGDEAKKRVDQLQAKFGDALQPALAVSNKKSSSSKRDTAESHGSSAAQMPGTPTEMAPLPPPDMDASLPPPASLMPDTLPPLPSPSSASSEPESSPSPSAPPN
ncbi:MAG: outer membrane protein assembly factor BamD [Chthoniobacterales bacterium]